jgi:hypothetical protein
MACASKGKMVTLPRTLNLSCGKDSMCQTGFSNMAWGKATCCYAMSACSLTNTKFDTMEKHENSWSRSDLVTRPPSLQKSSMLMIVMMNMHVLLTTLAQIRSVSCLCSLPWNHWPLLIIQNLWCSLPSPTNYYEILLLFPHTMCLPSTMPDSTLAHHAYLAYLAFHRFLYFLMYA